MGKSIEERMKVKVERKVANVLRSLYGVPLDCVQSEMSFSKDLGLFGEEYLFEDFCNAIEATFEIEVPESQRSLEVMPTVESVVDFVLTQF